MELAFQNPVFHAGSNVTVRRGDKYADLRPYCEIEIDGHGWATIERLTFLRFHDLTKRDLELEHDPQCRTIEGLLEIMQEVYPGFQTYELVTVIQFRIEPS